MKKILFVLSVLTMVMVVGCSNPTNTTIPVVIPPVVPTTEPETPATVEPEAPVTPAQPETPTQPETPATTEPEQPTEPQTPEDKSPYEYVKPDCVNLADYTYVGDYIFADTMNFAEWKYSNSETDYRLAFEKIARVKNDNPATRIIRYPHNATSEDDAISVIKATKYKIYVNNECIVGKNIGDNVFDCYNGGMEGTYDGGQIRISKGANNTYIIGSADGSISDYVAY